MNLAQQAKLLMAVAEETGLDLSAADIHQHEPIKADALVQDTLTIRTLDGKTVYAAIMFLEPAQIELINGYLQAKDEDHFQPEDNTISWTAIWPNRLEMDVKCCGAQTEPSWTEAVLFENGSEVCTTDVQAYYEGTWAIEDEGTWYVAMVTRSGPEPQDESPVVYPQFTLQMASVRDDMFVLRTYEDYVEFNGHPAAFRSQTDAVAYARIQGLDVEVAVPMPPLAPDFLPYDKVSLITDIQVPPELGTAGISYHRALQMASDILKAFRNNVAVTLRDQDDPGWTQAVDDYVMERLSITPFEAVNLLGTDTVHTDKCSTGGPAVVPHRAACVATHGQMANLRLFRPDAVADAAMTHGWDPKAAIIEFLECRLAFVDESDATATMSVSDWPPNARAAARNYADMLPDTCEPGRMAVIGKLVKALREDRLVVLPDEAHTEEAGEAALRKAMWENNQKNDAVTRFTSDAVAEKLAKDFGA